MNKINIEFKILCPYIEKSPYEAIASLQWQDNARKFKTSWELIYSRYLSFKLFSSSDLERISSALNKPSGSLEPSLVPSLSLADVKFSILDCG